MKVLAIPLLVATLGLATPTFANEAHHPDQAGSKAAATQSGPDLKGMQDTLTRMRTQLERIAGAKTDDERRAALSDHMQAMQTYMGMADNMQAGMMDCPMMKGGMGMMGGGMMGGGTGADMGSRMHNLEQRMDMMQMMMQQKMGSSGDGTMPMNPTMPMNSQMPMYPRMPMTPAATMAP